LDVRVVHSRLLDVCNLDRRLLRTSGEHVDGLVSIWDGRVRRQVWVELGQQGQEPGGVPSGGLVRGQQPQLGQLLYHPDREKQEQPVYKLSQIFICPIWRQFSAF